MKVKEKLKEIWEGKRFSRNDFIHLSEFELFKLVEDKYKVEVIKLVEHDKYNEMLTFSIKLKKGGKRRCQT